MPYISDDILHKYLLCRRNEFPSPENVESEIHFLIDRIRFMQVKGKKQDFFIQVGGGGRIPSKTEHSSEK